MAFTVDTIMPRAVSGLGAETLEARSVKGDNSTVYKHGMLLRKLTDGTVVPVASNANVGVHYVYAGPDLTAATADFVEVWRITEETRFLVQSQAAAATVPVQAHIGDQYDVNVTASTYVWSVDIDDADDANPIVEITNIWANVYDYAASSIDAAGTITVPPENDVYGLFEVKILPAQLSTAPAGS